MGTMFGTMTRTCLAALTLSFVPSACSDTPAASLVDSGDPCVRDEYNYVRCPTYQDWCDLVDAATTCTGTLEEVLARYTFDTVKVGCGIRLLRSRPNSPDCGLQFAFDAASGELIGGGYYGDTGRRTFGDTSKIDGCDYLSWCNTVITCDARQDLAPCLP